MCEYLCICDAIGVFTDYIEVSVPVNLEASSIFSYLDEYSNVVNEEASSDSAVNCFTIVYFRCRRCASFQITTACKPQL